MGRVNFGGMVKRVCLDYVPEVEVGDYTIVHVGFALSKIDEETALETLDGLPPMGVLEEELGTRKRPLRGLPLRRSRLVRMGVARRYPRIIGGSWGEAGFSRVLWLGRVWLVEGCGFPPISQNARNGWGTERLWPSMKRLVEGCGFPPISQNARNGWGTERLWPSMKRLVEGCGFPSHFAKCAKWMGHGAVVAKHEAAG